MTTPNRKTTTKRSKTFKKPVGKVSKKHAERISYIIRTIPERDAFATLAYVQQFCLAGMSRRERLAILPTAAQTIAGIGHDLPDLPVAQ